MSFFFPLIIFYRHYFLTDHFFQRRKTSNKPRDSTTAAGDTTAESVQNLIKKNPKYSKRINYEALKDLFVDNGSISANVAEDDDKDDNALIMMDDDKSDGEGLSMRTIIVEEEPGAVVSKPLSDSEGRGTKKKGVLALEEEMNIYEEGSDEEKDDNAFGWENAYEQEV